THDVNKENIDISKYKVGYTALKYKEKPDEDELEQQKYELENLFDGTTNPINPFSDHKGDIEVVSGLLTNEEMSTLNEDKTGETIILGDNDEFWKLNADEYIDIVFGVKLSDEAGNEFQGIQYEAEFKVEAKQTDEGAEYEE